MRVVFASRGVDVCEACHALVWEDLAPPRRFTFKHHLRCLQEEIREAEEERDEERVLLVRVTAAAVGTGERAELRGHIEEGDPRWIKRGGTLEGALDPPVGPAVEVTVLRKHKASVALEAGKRSWARLPEGATVRLTPRSSAQVQRTLLQAYLLARRLDPVGLDDPQGLPRIPRRLPEVLAGGMRPAQARAVQAAMALPEDGLLLVQGPPGTGKTTVIASMVRNALKRGMSVLVTSHTHVAIDNALRRILRQNPLLAARTARIGDSQSVATDMMAHASPLLDFVDPVDEPDARPLWRSLYAERPVVGMTLDGLASGFVRHREMPFEPFDLVIVDEAGMNLHPKLAIAKAAGRRLVLVGDHQQLPPIVTAKGFRNDAAYCKGPFEVLQAARGDLLVLLDEQFRSDPSIYQWSGDTVYAGRIRSGRGAARTIGRLLDQEAGAPVLWADTTALDARDERCDGSRVNRAHIAVAARVVQELVRDHGFPLEDIGYIAPFRKQAQLYTETVRRLGWTDADVLASTVDAFQGDERQAIVFDLTTTSPARPHEDPRRLNVSLTRAQDLLVVIGRRPFVARPAENPWLWSLQNWAAARTLPVPRGFLDARLRAQLDAVPLPGARPLARPAV